MDAENYVITSCDLDIFIDQSAEANPGAEQQDSVRKLNPSMALARKPPMRMAARIAVAQR